MLLIWLISCTGNGKIEDSTPAIDDTATDSGTTGTVPGEVALPECQAQSGDPDLIALSGVVLTPDGPVGGTVVYQPSTQKITCVGDCDTQAATVICTEGIISPGLLDPHDHLQYNSLPPWQIGPEFESRYDWQHDDRYYDYRTAFDEISDPYTCEIMKWAEARQLLSGVTGAVGSYGSDCMHLLLRNLDEDQTNSGLPGYSLTYSSSNVTSSVSQSKADDFLADLSSGSLDALVEHVAEGRDGSVRDEIDYMFEVGLVGPGVVYVHSTDASTQQLAQMGADGTGILWSPRSNLALYATTTPIPIAENLGVPWAIGTDWTPSGSIGELQELQCADEWLADKGAPISRSHLWDKGTTDAARLLNLDGMLGTLAVGMYADISVYSWGGKTYDQLFTAKPQDVKLVIVGGQALYGRGDWIDQLAAHPDWCESLDVCGESQKICLKAAESGDDAQTIAEIESTLTAAMANVTMPAGLDYAKELYPLFTCDPNPSCSLANPVSGDGDGDGVADGEDLCPDAYDPDQWDSDGDKIGDDCDKCPLDVGEDCAPVAGDADGDGIPDEEDNCRLEGNADQADADGDGTGDACDPCPNESNPGGAGCSFTVPQIQDASDASHPPDGTPVRISGLVVTGIRSGNGFHAQDPNATVNAGIYIYDQGANTVTIGDMVTVDGTYTEYYDLAEIKNPTVTITGQGSVPTAIEVAACDVATGGSLAEGYESMLLRVNDVKVTDSNADDSPDGSDAPDYNEFVVGGCLRIDDALYAYTDQPPVDTAYSSIVGVLGYGYSNFKLQPRDAGDLSP